MRHYTRDLIMNHATATLIHSFTAPSPLLRKALLADAITSGLTGVLLILAANALGSPLGLPVGLLRWSGVILIPFAALVGWLQRQTRLQRPLVFAVVALNAVWALDSVILLFTGWVQPTALGEMFVLAQAGAVAVLAEFQFVGLRRSTYVEAHTRR
jgi:hypothetical protein